MTDEPLSPLDILDQLEKTLRTLGDHSKWFFFEPEDPDDREGFQQLLNPYFQAPASDTGRPAANRPAQRNPEQRIEATSYRSENDSVLVAQRNPEQRIEATPQASAPVNMPLPSAQDPIENDNIDLDPLLAENLDSLKLRLRDCERCPLWMTRKTIVFGQGNQAADLVFIGEGPGEEEDKTGIAFVGRAGRLLTQIIQSIGINRESVYICNIVKCRPPGNRNPSGEEIVACSKFLLKQLELIQPKLIVTLGNIATKTLLPKAAGIMRMRGKIETFQGTPLMPTFHPSYLLRNPNALNPVWNDMRLIRQLLFSRGSSRGNDSDPKS